MTEFNPKTMLVTGGAGFIGSNFVRHVLSSHQSLYVVILDKLTYAGSLENLHDLPADRHQFTKGDIKDSKLLSKLFDEHEFDCVVHFAAESHVDRSIAGPAAFINTNIVGTYELLEAARSSWKNNTEYRFVHISTDEVYGSLTANQPAFSESDRYEPNSPYSASKAASDHLVRAWHHTFGLPVLTTNCSNNYGPYQHQEKLIPTVIRCCATGTPIPVYGDGSNIRDWLHVDDHCKGILATLQMGRNGETYNFGGKSEMSNLAIVETICAAMDEIRPDGAPHGRLINFVEDRPGHDWRYAVNAGKAIEQLGWRPIIEFGEGIRQTVDWFLGSYHRG